MKGSRVVKGFYKGGSLLEYLGAEQAEANRNGKEGRRQHEREWLIQSMLRGGEEELKNRATIMNQKLNRNTYQLELEKRQEVESRKERNE